MRRILPVFPVLAALFLAACESLPPPRDPAENLRLAAESGDMALFRRSVLEGADLDARDADGKTALILAAENGRTAIATNLLGGVTNWNPKAVPANGELRDRAGNTALLAAAGKNRAGTVGWLLACGADGDARTPDGETALKSLQVIWKLYEAERTGIVPDLRGFAIPEADLANYSEYVASLDRR